MQPKTSATEVKQETNLQKDTDMERALLTLTSVVSVLRLALKSDWNITSRLSLSKRSTFTTFSTTLEIKGRLDVGL